MGETNFSIDTVPTTVFRAVAMGKLKSRRGGLPTVPQFYCLFICLPLSFIVSTCNCGQTIFCQLCTVSDCCSCDALVSATVCLSRVAGTVRRRLPLFRLLRPSLLRHDGPGLRAEGAVPWAKDPDLLHLRAAVRLEQLRDPPEAVQRALDRPRGAQTPTREEEAASGPQRWLRSHR